MATFSLSRVPGKTRWDNAWTPSTLVYGGCPVMIRAIGNVREVQEMGEDGDPQTLSLELEMLRGVDEEALSKLLGRGTMSLGETQLAQ